MASKSNTYCCCFKSLYFQVLSFPFLYICESLTSYFYLKFQAIGFNFPKVPFGSHIFVFMLHGLGNNLTVPFVQSQTFGRWPQSDNFMTTQKNQNEMFINSNPFGTLGTMKLHFTGDPYPPGLFHPTQTILSPSPRALIGSQLGWKETRKG